MKRKTLKIILSVLLILVALPLLAYGYLKHLHPAAAREVSAEPFEAKPERVARGEYLFHAVSLCAHCHSSHDYTRSGWPIQQATLGEGHCDEAFDLPVCTSNITPHENGLGAWSDQQIARAIREGVDHEGNPLVPMMPYGRYREMSDEDVASLVVYLRTLAPREARHPQAPIPFPFDVLVKFAPSPLEGPVTAPPRSDSVEYGRYLVTVAACGDCHHGSEDRQFAGGNSFSGVSGPEVSANLTPDLETGLGRVSREDFIRLFAVYRDLPMDEAQQGPIRGVMPWLSYAHMTDEDLGAIYDYLRTVPAVKNPVVKFPEATAAQTP